jgi:hypothetical protein
VWRWLIISMVFGFPLSWAQISARQVAGVTYVSVSDLVGILGYSISESQSSLTIRSSNAVLILFADSPDISYAGNEDTLSAPVLKQEEWFAPDDVLSFLGLSGLGKTVTLPDGRTLTLEFPSVPTLTSARSAVVDLGNSVDGLAFYAPGTAGSETVSVLLLDVGLMSLAFPEQQKVFDELREKFTSGKPIYVVVTALANSPWEPVFTLEQQGRVLEYRVPSSLTLLEGDASSVGPDTPVSGVFVLPDWVNMRDVITVSWSGITATMQFRR